MLWHEIIQNSNSSGHEQSHRAWLFTYWLGLLLHYTSGMTVKAQCICSLALQRVCWLLFQIHWALRKQANVISEASGTEASLFRTNWSTRPSAAASLLCREHGQNPLLRTFHLLSSRSRMLFQNTLCCFPTFSKSFFKWHLLSKASPQNPSHNCTPLPSPVPALVLTPADWVAKSLTADDTKWALERQGLLSVFLTTVSLALRTVPGTMAVAGKRKRTEDKHTQADYLPSRASRAHHVSLTNTAK